MKHVKSNLQEAVEIARAIPVNPKHAVFATSPELRRVRVSRWMEWGAATDEWTRLDDRRRANEMPHVRHFEVRSSDDPSYRGLDYEPWQALPVEERPQWVKLSRDARESLLAVGRRAGSLQDAADAMFDVLIHDSEWSHLAAVTISDYTWAAAQFCFPHESKNW